MLLKSSKRGGIQDIYHVVAGGIFEGNLFNAEETLYHDDGSACVAVVTTPVN